MQIFGSPTTPPQPLRLQLPAQAFQGLSLRDGDSLTAVVRNSEAAGKLLLEINGKRLEVLSNLKLREGMKLQLQVERTSSQLLLRLSDRDMQHMAQQQALRLTLPRQEAMKPLFERLQALHSANPARGEALTGKTTGQRNPEATASPPRTSHVQATAKQNVQQAISRLMAALPTLTQLSSGKGLEKAVLQSGLFLESHLRQAIGGGTAHLEQDVKNTLLRLARSIRMELATDKPTVPEQKPSGDGAKGLSRDALQLLLRQVDSGVARIQLNQLNTLAQQGQADERQVINLELPLFHQKEQQLEVIRMRIQRERRRGGTAQGDWSVTLQLSPEGFGNIAALVSLCGGKVSTTFWCEQEQTSALFRQEMEQLHERLAEQGLEVGRCNAITGKAPEELETEPPLALTGLIDTRA